MTTSRTFLALSVAGFCFGFSGVLWGIGMPVGAISLGLFLISKVMEKEATLFDCEHRVRLAMAERQRAAVRRPVAMVARTETQTGKRVVAMHAH